MRTLIFILPLFLISGLSAGAADSHKKMKNSLEDIDTRLSELEINSALQTIRFSGFASTSADYFSAYNFEHSSNKNPTNRRQHVLKSIFELNGDSQVSPNLHFHATMRAGFLFNDETQTGRNEVLDYSNPLNGPNLFLSKAYFDYHPKNTPFILSVGRLPTTFGPPEHLRDGSQRLGTYPVAAFSIPLDGLSLSWDIADTFKMESDFYFRVIYAPFSVGSRENPWEGAPLGFGTQKQRVSRAKDHTGFTGMIEHIANENKIWNKFISILQFNWVQFNGFNTTPFTGLFTGQVVNGTKIEEDNSVYQISASQEKLTILQGLSGYIEFQKLFGSNLDFYSFFKKTWIRTRGNLNFRRVRTGLMTNSAGADVSGVFGTIGNAPVTTTTFLANGDQQGGRFFAGMRYTLKEKNILGLEYVRASPNALNTGAYSLNALKLTGIQGQGFHGFYTRKMWGDFFSIRFGYQEVILNAVFNVTVPVEAKTRIKNAYTHILVKF